MLERRRAGRLTARLYTQIVGIDAELKLRRSNLSATGIFFEIDTDVGEPGSVQQLRLMTVDGAHQFEVLARVVRTFTTNDIWRGVAVAGIAFDYMPPAARTRGEIEAMVRHLSQPRGGERPGAAAAIHFRHAASPLSAGTGPTLAVRGMILETAWAAEPGEAVRCEITAPQSNQSFVLAGEVTASTSEPDPSGDLAYHVAVRFHDHGQLSPAQLSPAAGRSIGDAIDALLEEASFEQVETGFSMPNEHLKGLLSRIRLSSLLAFLEMERLTGVLTLTRTSADAAIYVRRGQVVDCEAPRVAAEPLAAMARLLAWQEGTFEFGEVEVERDDRLALSTTHLLLKLTTEAEQPTTR